MPVSVLTAEQCESYGRYASTPSPNDLSRSCHLDDAELMVAWSIDTPHSCSRRVRMTHAPIGQLAVDESIRLG
jgi:hypothetical protein